ncbi:type 1 glutamine amidotransferase domain-containing protein [Oceanomicrobium pacificus]|uniref:Type 1 glutamine amidotransferase domain-containing protein n=1 Tax=Oceanomicrobium pacificus TaxID=2692916 RepID=A0A6B0TRH4_9RHOB|nr:type 1 glutamine amidotransferase domain-containing protein [Oceanomicrobium pacificus]MXU64338.1 type 1 glutamine amidotransferase domain-containing protein [Oceanomicrobium pacificus]
MKKILFVLTSHTDLGDTGKPTGFYFEEMAAPYYALTDAGHEVTLASIAGGAPDPDPGSLDADEDARPAPVRRFLADKAAMTKLAETKAIADTDVSGFDAIFLPGGHGTAFDFPESDALAERVGQVFDQGGIVAAVCHGPAGLVNAKTAHGAPLVEGRRVNSFTDAEERAVELDGVVPFLLESRLRQLGAHFEAGDTFTEKAVRDGRLITGQNPMSSDAVARLMVEALGES